MKKLISSSAAALIAVIMIINCCGTAFAAEKNTQQAAAEQGTAQETTQDASQPRLMVVSYKLDSDSLYPDKSSKLSITYKNYSKTKQLSNIKLTAAEESGEIKISGMGTKYVEKIKAGGTYVWELQLTASKTAAIGEHKLTVSAEYEDKYYTSYTSSDTLSVNIKQSVGLDYDGIILPSKLQQEDTAALEITLMNTGKSKLRNCKIVFEVDSLESGGASFVGEIPAGESASITANLRAAGNKTGEASGKAILSYEDEFGDNYSTEIPLSTVIEEKKELPQQQENEKEEKSNPLWWLFMISGAAAGGLVGFGIPAVIRANKQRKEDEKML